MITERIKNEILDYIENLVGADATGLFISSAAVDGDCDPHDDFIFTNIDTGSVLDLDACDFNCGASKFVINYNNYVIKIPFTGYYCRDFESDAVYLGGYWEATNPCAEEELIYENASNEMKELLLPNIFIGNVNNCFPVYIQETISHSFSDRDYTKDKIKEETIDYQILKRLEKELFTYSYRVNLIFLVPFVAKFGIKKTKEAMIDINELDDLHSDNYGYLSNGRPVIFDYAGYDRSSWGVKNN